MVLVEEEIALLAGVFLKRGLGVNRDSQGCRALLDPWDLQDPLEFQERKGGEVTVALLEEQVTKEIRVQLVSPDFQV